MKINSFHACRTPLLLALLFSSCALVGAASSPRRVPFDESALTAYAGQGSGSVAGQLVVTSSNGKAHLADDGNPEDRIDGTVITLIPVTAYTKEMVERELGHGENLSPSDPRFHKYVRLTRTDAGGHFGFTKVPAGEYFLTGEVKGNTSDDFSYRWACERVHVGKGQAVKIKLTHNPQLGSSPVLVIWTFE